MVEKNAVTAARHRWAAEVAALDGGRTSSPRREPITVDRIVDIALDLVASDGFDALTMRRVAAALQTGPASLYAHVRSKADLDDRLIGSLCVRVRLPTPDPARWTEQIHDVCRQLRDLYLRYPGISRAASTTVPTTLETLRISEGLLAILLTGGVPPQSAAWAIDAALLYVGAYSVEMSLRRSAGADADGNVLDRAELMERLATLPVGRFPHTVAYARELTSGEGHDRFDFTLDLLLGGLVPAAR